MTICTSCIHCLPFTERFCNERGREVQKCDGTFYCHAPQNFRGLKPDYVTGGYVFEVDGNKRPRCVEINRHGECRMFEEIPPMKHVEKRPERYFTASPMTGVIEWEMPNERDAPRDWSIWGNEGFNFSRCVVRACRQTDAERIALCLNYCSGMTNEQLQQGAK